MIPGIGLRTKALLGIAGIVVLLGLAVIFFAKPALQQKLFIKLQQRGISIAKSIASNTATSVLTENYFELEMLLKDFRSSEEDIVYIFIVDAHGKVLTHTFKNGFPSDLRNINTLPPAQKYALQRIATEKGEIIDVAVPLLKGELGTVHLGISGEHITEDVQSIITLIIWLILAVLIVAAIMGTLLSRIITKPILELTRIAKLAGEGDLDQRVPVGANDEIGQLEMTFNHMLQRRKEAEEALRKSEKKLSSITSHLAEGIYVYDESGRIDFMNPEAERLLGWTIDELNDKGAHSLIHFRKADGTPLPFDECGMHNVIKSGKRFVSADEVFIKKDGTVFPISVISGPIEEDGKVIGSVTAFRDITERKKLEHELMKARNLESIGLLAGGMAHDFNNLLQGLLGNIQIAKMHLKPGDTAYGYIEQAESVYGPAINLTHQLLTFAGGGSPVKRPVRMGERLRHWVNFALSGSNLKGDFDIDEDRCPVEVDEGQMRQVIHNLVINAVEAMPGGGVLRVRSHKVDVSKKEGLPLKEGVYMEISIKDQGIGIPERYITKIFDPYFSTKDMGNQKGMGLGLTICYSIVKRHGGCITVESKEGTGSTFHIHLPVSEKELLKANGELTERSPSLCKKKVLVMDDEKTITDVAGAYLTQLGYDVEVARDGSDAIGMYKNAEGAGSPFDIVILDLTVPGGMGGKETILKLLEIDPQVKAVVTSGYSNDPIMTDYTQSGFLGTLAKPYTLKELGSVLSRVIRHTPLEP